MPTERKRSLARRLERVVRDRFPRSRLREREVGVALAAGLQYIGERLMRHRTARALLEATRSDDRLLRPLLRGYMPLLLLLLGQFGPNKNARL